MNAIREAKQSNNFRKLLGRVKKTSRKFASNENNSSDNLSSSVNSDNKLKIGQDTYTFIFQKVEIMNMLMNIIIFMDVSQQEKLFSAELERKYKNIFLSSVSHSLRTPLNCTLSTTLIINSIADEQRDTKAADCKQ